MISTNQIDFPLWDDYKSEFDYDNGLLKIIIQHKESGAMQRLVDFLSNTDAELIFLRDEKPAQFPDHIDMPVENTQHQHRLLIRLNGITVLCPLDLTGTIELSVDPGQIDNEARARIIFRLISTIGRTLDCEVKLFREHRADSPLFQYTPGTGICFSGNSR